MVRDNDETKQQLKTHADGQFEDVVAITLKRRHVVISTIQYENTLWILLSRRINQSIKGTIGQRNKNAFAALMHHR